VALSRDLIESMVSGFESSRINSGKLGAGGVADQGRTKDDLSSGWAFLLASNPAGKLRGSSQTRHRGRCRHGFVVVWGPRDWEGRGIAGLGVERHIRMSWDRWGGSGGELGGRLTVLVLRE
jgi:hypothetical protein